MSNYKTPAQEWVVVFNDGTHHPAENFLLSDGTQLAVEHGGVKGLALVVKDVKENTAD